MSRTYRKSSLTETRSKKRYVDEQMDYLYQHYRYEYYMTESDEIAYEDAIKQYKIDYHVWLNSQRNFSPCYWKMPKEPMMWQFKRRKSSKVEYDYDYEISKLEKEYDTFKRDNKFYESNRNTSYKKRCAKDLRHKNKEVIRKILRGDVSWEDKPFPDTYLGKQYVWEY